MFNMAVLPFCVLSDNHKIHIFMSKEIKKKNVSWSVNDTKPKASIYSHYHGRQTTIQLLLMPGSLSWESACLLSGRSQVQPRPDHY